MAGGPKTRAEPSLHDLRQPLTAILSAATALQSDPTIDDDVREEMLRIVIENAERLRGLLSELDQDAAPDVS
jgi:signal transduction histidine kinase